MRGLTYLLIALVILLTATAVHNASFSGDRRDSNLLTGSFIIAKDYVNDRSGYDSLLDEMKDMGMNRVILHSIGYVFQDGSYVRNVTDDVLDWMLSDAGDRGFDVYIGLYESRQADYWNNPMRDSIISQDTQAVQDIESKFGDRAYLKGYYVVQEVFVGVHHLYILDDIFTPLISGIHDNTNRPVMVSGYMAPWDYGNTTQEIGDWIHDFIFGSSSNSGCDVDIFLLQDGVGSFDNRIIATHGETIEDYFVAAKNGASPKELWADVELFQWNPDKSFSGDSNWYLPATAIRVNAQLYLINQAGIEEKISWINQHHMTQVGKNYHPDESRHMYRGYMCLYYWWNYYGNPHYYAVQRPSPNYPDRGGMLFDDVVGQVWYDDWVGWNESTGYDVSIIVYLGDTAVPVSDVSAVVRSETNAAIYFPTKMTVEISNDNVTYTLLGEFNNPYHDSESYSKATFWVSTESSQYARYVKITFHLGGWWFFLSELEIYGVSEVPEFNSPPLISLIALLSVILAAFRRMYA